MRSRARTIAVSVVVATIGLGSTARSEPNAKYSQAIVHFDNAQYDEAWRKLEEAKGEHPELMLLAKIHRLEGRILVARQQWVDGVVSFFRSLDIEPLPDISRYAPEAQNLAECAKRHHDARLSESTLRLMLEKARLDLPWTCPDASIKPPVDTQSNEPGEPKIPTVETTRCALEDGWKLSAAGKYQEAKTCLAEVVSSEPHSSPARQAEVTSLEATIACGEHKRTISVLAYFDAIHLDAGAAQPRSTAPDCAAIMTCAAHHARAQSKKEELRRDLELAEHLEPWSCPPIATKPQWAVWATGAMSLAAVGAGTFFGLSTLSKARDHDPATDPSGTALGATISFGTAGATAIAALVLYLTQDQ